MTKLVALQQKRGKLAADMRKLIDETDSETGMNEDQEAKWQAMTADLSILDGQIAKDEQVAALEANLNEVPDPAGRETPIDNQNENPFASQEYQDNFQQFLRNSAMTAPVQAALSIGVDTEGGFTVPQSWVASLIAKLTDNVVIRQMATVIQTDSTNNLPLVSDNGAAGWVDEGGVYPESDIVFGSGVLKAWKAGRIMKVSEELLQDSMINLEGEISRVFGLTFGLLEEDAYINGDGANKPTGLLVTALNGKTAAANNAITYDELVDLVYSVREVYRQGSAFLMNSTTAALLRKLKSTDGIPLWQPSVQVGQPDTFLGYPVRTAESMPSVGSTTTPVSFGNYSNYRIADRGGIFMQRLNELYAATGYVGFKMRKRTDGKLLVAESIKKLTMAV